MNERDGRLRRPLDRDIILAWLREDDPAQLERLWAAADETRRRHVGDEVHLRGLIEISQPLRARLRLLRPARRQPRDRALPHERRRDPRAAPAPPGRYGYGTVVLQSGEDYGIRTDWMAGVVRGIKAETALAVTLSLGERPEADLTAWREAGADRYLLRFETSDEELYGLIHPDLPGRVSDRMALLETLQGLGYEVGSGVMIGIPGQTLRERRRRHRAVRHLDLDMIGVGPYIAHPLTPLGDRSSDTGDRRRPSRSRATSSRVYKVVALTRLVRPDANIPSTTALATINKVDGRELGLQRGANIVMPNLTPPEYRVQLRDLPGQGLRERDGRDVPRLPVGPYRVDRARRRRRARWARLDLTSA